MTMPITEQPLTQNLNQERDIYQARVKAELDKLDARISEYRAKLDYAKADQQAQYHDLIDQLTTQRDAIAQRFEELQKAGDSAWADLQAGFDRAWTDVNTAFQNAAQQFDRF
ncbi:MAG: hypothetical protein O2890_06375 [Cyanobacteria bacterium]|nr:hypothetical protein [Cyanobacteriota bacterium]MDA0866031.1 hypothetical protein [Cyanobacteriota bacterium]